VVEKPENTAGFSTIMLRRTRVLRLVARLPLELV
jgi:hypothetical protein